MALFRQLFGKTLGGEQTNKETAEMLGSKLAKSSKLKPSENDLGPLEVDPLVFEFHTYPNDLYTLSNGHYIKFDIFENNLSKLSQAPSPNNPFRFDELEVAKIELEDLTGNITRTGGKAIEDNTGINSIDKESAATKSNITSGELKGDDFVKQIQSSGMNKMRERLKGKTAREINEELNLHSHTHSISKGSILLYTPSTNTFGTAATYENSETGFLSDFLNGGNLFDSLQVGAASAFQKLAGAAVTTALEIVVPGAGGFFNRSTGMAVNPNMELAFKSVPFRQFSFDYKFAPKDKKELNSVHKIIQLFRFHMSPALIGKTQYFASPSQFELSYMYRDDENTYIPRITRCVLENIEVDYSPGDKFTTLRPDDQGASPQLITMKMQFREMSIITKETIAEGY